MYARRIVSDANPARPVSGVMLKWQAFLMALLSFYSCRRSIFSPSPAHLVKRSFGLALHQLAANELADHFLGNTLDLVISVEVWMGADIFWEISYE